ncbi:MAG: hypothetical protein U0528_16440 [Anaerolineae bacterium]
MTDRRIETAALDFVLEGMDVYDVNEKRVGIVRTVFYGLDDMTSSSSGADAGEAFDGEKRLPAALASRLRREGFIQINWSGLFAPDRYATPEQIGYVDQHVHLSVRGDELPRR